jgi:YgiT-type zinc finger domain-containing protein
LGDIDWLTVSAAEKGFMRALGLFSICPCCGVAALVRDTRDHAITRSDGQPVTIKALTGDYCNACGEVILDAAEGQRLMDATRGEGTT